MARPQIQIDKKDFESLLVIQCSLEEVTAFFDNKLGGCSSDTIERWCKRTYKDEHGKSMSFADVAAKKRALGKISIRRNQFELSKKNAAVAIWLGKQYLGQRDTPESTEKNEGMLSDLIDGLKNDDDEG